MYWRSITKGRRCGQCGSRLLARQTTCDVCGAAPGRAADASAVPEQTLTGVGSPLITAIKVLVWIGFAIVFVNAAGTLSTELSGIKKTLGLDGVPSEMAWPLRSAFLTTVVVAFIGAGVITVMMNLALDASAIRADLHTQRPERSAPPAA
jgi:hypothetical protein